MEAEGQQTANEVVDDSEGLAVFPTAFEEEADSMEQEHIGVVAGDGVELRPSFGDEGDAISGEGTPQQ